MYAFGSVSEKGLVEIEGWRPRAGLHETEPEPGGLGAVTAWRRAVLCPER